MKDEKSSINQLIEKGDTLSAIHELKKNKGYRKKATLLLNRYNRIRKEYLSGITTKELYDIEINKINLTLLKISPVQKSQNKLIIVLSFFIAIILIAIYFLNIKNEDSSNKEVVEEEPYPAPEMKRDAFALGATPLDLFKVLILPFNPDKNCTFENSDYERQLLERLETKNEKDNLKIEFTMSKVANCPSTVSQAADIALKNNVDMVVWGQFIEECEDETQIRIRSTLNSDYNGLIENPYPDREIDYVAFSDTDFQKLDGLNQLREGYIQNEIDFMIYYGAAIKMMRSVEIGNYDDILILFDNAFSVLPSCPTETMGSLRFDWENMPFLQLNHYQIKFDSLVDNNETININDYWGVNKLKRDIELVKAKAKYYELEVKYCQNSYESYYWSGAYKIVVGNMHFDNMIQDFKTAKYYYESAIKDFKLGKEINDKDSRNDFDEEILSAMQGIEHANQRIKEKTAANNG